MKLFLFVCLFAATSAADEIEPKKTSECEGIHVRGQFRKKEVLARGINRPYQLALLKHSHEIFYSFNDGDDEEDTFKIGYIQKNHTGHKVLDEIKNGFALASDNEHHLVFIGGSDGIYKFQADKKEKQVEKILHDHNIWDMFYDKELYFITYPKQHLYKWNVHKEKSSPVRVKEIHENIYQFAIDKDNDRFITNDTGVFKIGAKSSVRKQMEGPKIYRAIEISNKGHAYFCGKNAIYVADKKKHVLEKIAGIKSIFGLVFDRDDNMVYSDPHEIVRLLPEDCPKPK